MTIETRASIPISGSLGDNKSSLSQTIVSSNNDPSSASLWQRYNHSLDTHPLYTKSMTSAVLYSLQEIIATFITTKSVKKETLSRSMKMFLYGMTVSGPVGHYLYGALEWFFRTRKDTKSLILKLIASNTIISPILNGLYLTAMSLMAGIPPEKVFKVLFERLPKMMKTSWLIFPAIQLFAFKYMRQALWLPFFSFVAFLFGTYMNVVMKLKMLKGNNTKKSPPPSQGKNSSKNSSVAD